MVQHLSMSGGLRSRLLSSHTALNPLAAPAAQIWAFCLFHPWFCFFSAHKKDRKKEKKGKWEKRKRKKKGKRKREKGKGKKEKRDKKGNKESSVVFSKSKCNSLSS